MFNILFNIFFLSFLARQILFYYTPFFFFQAEDGIRDRSPSRGLGDVYKRQVYFDARAKLHLQNYLKCRTDDNPALFVTLNDPHKRLKISGVEIRLRQLGRELKLERIHPHKFRRTMATRAIDKGMPIEQVQKLLGHQQIDTTMPVSYTHLTLPTKRIV